VLVTIMGTPKQTQTLDELLPSMLQMEQQIRADEQETVPIYAARDGMRRKQPRHNQQRNSRSVRPRSLGSCQYYGKKGHMESECRTRKQDQQGIRTVAYGASAIGASNEDWVIDSGAFKHLTPHRQDLRNYRSVAPNSAVTFANGHQAAAVGQGEVMLRVQTTSGCTDVTLQAVLHVTEATVNLFSIRQAMNNGAQVTFRHNKCFVSSNDIVTMEGVSQRDGTMVIRQSRQQPTYALAVTTTAWYIAIQYHDNPVSQHGTASYLTEFKSQSFRRRSKIGVALAQQESCWRSQQSVSASKSRGKGRARLWQFFWSWSLDCCVVHMQTKASLKAKAC